jgi:hypothetical protein
LLSMPSSQPSDDRCHRPVRGLVVIIPAVVDRPLRVGLGPSRIIGSYQGSDHAIAPGEYLGRVQGDDC